MAASTARTTGRAAHAGSLIRVRAGEGRRVALMVVYSAAAFGGVYGIGKAIATALFVSRLAPADIPYMFIITGLVTAPALAAYNAVSARLAPTRVVILSTGACVVLLVCLRLLLASSLSGRFGVLAALYAVSDLAATLVLLQFWTHAGQVFDVRQARRLFGVIAAGGTVSSLLAGITLRTLSSAVGADNMLFLVMLALAGCAACSLALHHLQGERLTVRRAVQRSSLTRSLRLVTRSPLMLSVALLTILVASLSTIGAYQFFLGLNSHFGNRSASTVASLGSSRSGRRCWHWPSRSTSRAGSWVAWGRSPRCSPTHWEWWCRQSSASPPAAASER